MWAQDIKHYKVETFKIDTLFINEVLEPFVDKYIVPNYDFTIINENGRPKGVVIDTKIISNIEVIRILNINKEKVVFRGKIFITPKRDIIQDTLRGGLFKKLNIGTIEANIYAEDTLQYKYYVVVKYSKKQMRYFNRESLSFYYGEIDDTKNCVEVLGKIKLPFVFPRHYKVTLNNWGISKLGNYECIDITSAQLKINGEEIDLESLVEPLF